MSTIAALTTGIILNWDGSPRPGVIPGTIESLGPIEVDPTCPSNFEPPSPNRCDAIYESVLASCLSKGKRHSGSVLKAAGAAMLCALGNIGRGDDDGGSPPMGPSPPPGYYPIP